MSFNKIIGHKKQIEFLKEATSNNRLSHGYVFEGTKGLGKKLVATEFVKGIFCLEMADDSCGVCANCLKLDTGNHPDYLFVEPDGASIKNKQVEEIQNFIAIKPYESKVKVVVISDSNAMTISAQNRLLKVLEEPSGDAMMILISENIEGLLPTIKSRCQRIRFNRLAKSDIDSFIMTHYNVSDEARKSITVFSEGSIGKVVDYIDSDVFREGRRKVFDLIAAIHKKDFFKSFLLMEFFVADKENIVQLLDFMIMLYRDILLLKEVGNQELMINSDMIDQILLIEKQVTSRKILIYIDHIEKCKVAIRSNTNLVIAMETLLFNIQEE